MNTFEKILTGVGALGVLAVASQYAEGSVKKEPSLDKFCMYSDAMNVIYQTDMFSTTRDELIRIIPAGASGDYYSAIIAAVKNKKFDSNLVSQIKNITRAFGYKV